MHTDTLNSLLAGITQGQLRNGLKYVLYAERSLPVAAVCVLYRVGARNDPLGRAGLAHLMEHMMFQGTARVRPNRHIEYIRDAGGTANGDTTLECTSFTQVFPASVLEPVLWMEADRMASIAGSIRAERLDTQRRVVIQERRQRYDSRPLALAWETAISLAHPEGDPYRHMPAGRTAELNAVTEADAVRFASLYYTPGNAVVSVIGDFSRRRCVRWIERYFGDVPSSRPAPRPAALPIDPPALPWDSATGPDTMALSVFRLPPEGDDSGPAAFVTATALSASLQARLLRHGIGCVRHCTVDTMEIADWPALTLFGIAAAGHADAAEAGTAADQVLEEFAATGPEPAEVELALHLTGHDWLRRTSSADGKAIDLARSTALLGSPHARAQRALAAERVSPDAIRAAARFLEPQRCARLLVDQTNQINRIKQINQTRQISRTNGHHSGGQR